VVSLRVLHGNWSKGFHFGGTPQARQRGFQDIARSEDYAAFDEIRKSVAGYDVSMSTLLLGEAERTSPASAANGNANFDVPAGSIFSSHDTLFTSGSLGRYCSTILSLPEATEEVEVEAGTEHTVTLDFDAAASIQVDETGSGTFILKPVVKEVD